MVTSDACRVRVSVSGHQKLALPTGGQTIRRRDEGAVGL